MWRLYLNRYDSENQDDTIGEEGIITHNKSGIELFIIGCPFSYFWYVCFIYFIVVYKLLYFYDFVIV